MIKQQQKVGTKSVTFYVLFHLTYLTELHNFLWSHVCDVSFETIMATTTATITNNKNKKKSHNKQTNMMTERSVIVNIHRQNMPFKILNVYPIKVQKNARG